MKVISLVSDYEVASRNVTLEVIIGDAQIGSSIVKLGKREIGRGDVSRLLVGAGSSLRGKPLFVKSVVTDVNDATNHTTITYELRGGRKPQDFVSSGSVDENGDSVIYRAKFNLV